MIELLSQKEIKYLVSNGVKFGENGISHTLGNGKKSTYYLTESNKNMKLLRNIRK